MSRTHFGWTLSEKKHIKTDMIGKGLSNGLSSLFLCSPDLFRRAFFIFKKEQTMKRYYFHLHQPYGKRQFCFIANGFVQVVSYILSNKSGEREDKIALVRRMWQKLAILSSKHLDGIKQPPSAFFLNLTQFLHTPFGGCR